MRYTSKSKLADIAQQGAKHNHDLASVAKSNNRVEAFHNAAHDLHVLEVYAVPGLGSMGGVSIVIEHGR